MSILAYCCGPFSTKKNSFCNEFSKENKDYKLINLHNVRKKITGSILPTDEASELLVKKEMEKILSELFKRKKRILINGLFLNKKARILFKNSIQALTEDSRIKKICIAFKCDNLGISFEENQKDKILKKITFDHLRSQDSIFTFPNSAEEADLVINKFQKNEKDNLLEVHTKLWSEDRIIHCDNYKKLSEFFAYGKSFE